MMGGARLGRRPAEPAYPTTGEVERLDVRALARHLEDGLWEELSCLTYVPGGGTGAAVITAVAFSESGQRCSASVRFRGRLRHDRDAEWHRTELMLVATQPQYGGRRWWARCPGRPGQGHCGRRVAILYRPEGSRYFACRHCWTLRYPSRRETDAARLAWKAEQLCAQLGVRPHSGHVQRPKGMRRSTFRQLVAAAQTAEMQPLVGVFTVCDERLRRRTSTGWRTVYQSDAPTRRLAAMLEEHRRHLHEELT